MRQERPGITAVEREQAVRGRQYAFGIRGIAVVAALAGVLLQFSGCVIDGSHLITPYDTGSPLGGNVVMARPEALPTTVILGSKKGGNINLTFTTPDDAAVNRLNLLFKTYNGGTAPYELGLEPSKSYLIAFTDFANGVGTITVDGGTAKAFSIDAPVADAEGPNSLNIYASRVNVRRVAICIEDQHLFGQLMIRSN